MINRSKTAFLLLALFGFFMPESYVMAEIVQLNNYMNNVGDFNPDTGILEIGINEDMCSLDKIEFPGCENVRVVNIRNTSAIRKTAFKHLTNLEIVNIYAQNEMYIGRGAFLECPIRELHFIHPLYENEYYTDTPDYMPFRTFIDYEIGSFAFENLQVLSFNGPWTFDSMYGPNVFIKPDRYTPLYFENDPSDSDKQITAYCNDSRAYMHFLSNCKNGGTMKDLYKLRHEFSKSSFEKNPIVSGVLSIPNTYRSFDVDTFNGVRNVLTDITIPESIKCITAGLFKHCKTLKTVKMHDKIESIDNDAFIGCDSLSSIQLPKKITRIGHGTFFGCKSLSEIVIPDSVQNIDSLAFGGCASLKNVTLPRNVKRIGSCVFAACSADLIVQTYSEEIKKQLEEEGVTSKLLTK